MSESFSVGLRVRSLHDRGFSPQVSAIIWRKETQWRLTEEQASRDESKTAAVRMVEVLLPLRHGLEAVQQGGIVTERKVISAECPQRAKARNYHSPQIEHAEIQADAMQHVDPQARVFPPRGIGVVTVLAEGQRLLRVGHRASQVEVRWGMCL